MRIPVVPLLAIALAAFAALPAQARPGDFGGPGDGSRFHPRHRFLPSEGLPPADPEQRVLIREMRRREFEARQEAEPPSFGRLSPEERRQLRQDIRSAREGIYRRPPPPPLPLAPPPSPAVPYGYPPPR